MSAPVVRNREVRGPGVADFGIIGRSYSGRPVEQMILDSRAAEDARALSDQQARLNAKEAFKTKWENDLERVGNQSASIRLAAKQKMNKQQALDERKERLRALLEAENAQYIVEIGATVETELERQARMRDRAKTLREQREQDRVGTVEAKKYQQWMLNCEELRTMRTKVEHEVIAEDRVLQVREKEMLRDQQAQVDKLWDEQWMADKRKKDERAARDEADQKERNRVQTLILKQQIAQIEASRQEEALLHEQEQQLRLQEMQLMAEEARREEALRAEHQRLIRADLDKFNRRTMAMKAKEMQEEMAIDMKLLEDCIASARNEAKESLDRKQQFAREVELYKQYLEEVRQFQKVRDAEGDAWLESENQRVLQKQLDKWEREKQARVKLMAEVLAVRRDQVAAKLVTIEEGKQRNLAARAVLDKQREEYEYEEQSRALELRHNRLAYQTEILNQVADNDTRRKQQRQEEVDEARRLQELDEANQARMQAQLMEFTMTQTKKSSRR